MATGTLANWRSQGAGPSWHKLPGSGVVLYDLATLEAFVAAGMVQRAA